MVSCFAMDMQDIIKQLGGPVFVGQHLGISSQAVSNWKRVPADRVPQLMGIAKSMGVTIRAEDMRPDIEWRLLHADC